MNIVLYVNSFLPLPGGRELVVYHLGLALKKLGHRVRVVGPGGWWCERKIRFPYPVHRWPSSKGIFTEQVNFFQLMLDVGIWGCDVIHAHNTYPTGYTAARLKKLMNVPLVITPHGEDIHVVPEIQRGLRLNPLLGCKIRRALEGAEIVTAISRSVENSLLDAGTSPERIRLIPNGVNLERFRKIDGTPFHERFGIPRDSRLLVTIGNYRPVKGYEVLIRAMPAVLAKEQKARLIIIGANTEVLNPLIRQLNLTEKVILTGRIPFPTMSPNLLKTKIIRHETDIVAGILNAGDVYVSAGVAEGAEGLPLSVLDAMAAGSPVVASDISGNRDVICDGENGLLVPPGDAERLAKGIIRILNDEELRFRMAGKAQGRAQAYNWTAIASQYIDVYAEAMEESTFSRSNF